MTGQLGLLTGRRVAMQHTLGDHSVEDLVSGYQRILGIHLRGRGQDGFFHGAAARAVVPVAEAGSCAGPHSFLAGLVLGHRGSES